MPEEEALGVPRLKSRLPFKALRHPALSYLLFVHEMLVLWLESLLRVLLNAVAVSTTQTQHQREGWGSLYFSLVNSPDFLSRCDSHGGVFCPD